MIGCSAIIPVLSPSLSFSEFDNSHCLINFFISFGSNLFNTLGVLAIPGLILPFQIPGEVMSRDFIYMIALTLLILVLSLKLKINRFGGIILLVILVSYLYQLVWI